MFVSDDRFPFARGLSLLWPVLRDEARALSEDDWLLWTEYAGFDGAWHLAPLFASIQGVPLDHVAAALPRLARRCPATMEALSQVEGLTGAAFSRLSPGTHIHSHVDHPGFLGVVRGHLGLDVPDGGMLRCGGLAREWVEGGWLFFRTEQEHEAVNLGSRPRTVLLLDVNETHYPKVR